MVKLPRGESAAMPDESRRPISVATKRAFRIRTSYAPRMWRARRTPRKKIGPQSAVAPMRARWRLGEVSVGADVAGGAHGLESRIRHRRRRLDEAPCVLVRQDFRGQLRMKRVPRAMRDD